MKRLLIIFGLLITSIILISGCSSRHRGSWNVTPNPNTNNAPTVTAVVPLNNATNVAINTKVTATFSKAMNPGTITAATFTLKHGSTAVTGNVAFSGVTAVFTPAGNLAANTVYTATITTGARDTTGRALAANYSWSFTTGTTADTTAPTVSSTFPADAATGVMLNAKLSAVFSEAMDPLTIAAATFTLKQGVSPVLGSVTYSGVTAVFTPTNPLASNSVYTATITTGVTDLANNALASNYTWSFTTGATADTTAPTVSFTVPGPGATNVPIGNKLSATFSEPMDPATITTTTFTLKQGAADVLCTVTYSGVTAVLAPVSPLLANTEYTATITTGARDAGGVALAANYTWSFTTGFTLDTTAPTVSFTAPANGATGVAINTEIAATFSEVMDASTITSATFTLRHGANAVPGTVNYAGFTAVFTPASLLLSGAEYTATITTGAMDLAGNGLETLYSWSFTTGAAMDTTAPFVISTVPNDGASGVPINAAITATFSEPMNPLSITTRSFHLSHGTTATPGIVTYLGTTATFTPNHALEANTLYTASINTEAQDLAGNPLVATYSWDFTTGAILDTSSPTVISVSPEDLAIGVALNTTITATFSEPMNPLSITTRSFHLDQGTTPIHGIVTYLGDTATFTPNHLLLADTTYTATINIEAEDLAGNPLLSNYVWSFTTGAEVVPGPVDLGMISPFGSFGGGAGMTNEGLLTVINGDIGTTGAATTITGFHDNVPVFYTVTPLNNGWVNGTVYTATSPEAVAGALAARAAYNALTPASMPGGFDPGAGQLGGLTLPPGIYQAAGGSFLLTGSDLTLDGQGDANAFWVFQMASSLTIGAPAAPRSIHLINGAQSKNIFWQVGSAATINPGGGGTVEGTIIAQAGVVISTSGSMIITTLNGRALGLDASVTMVNTIINIPAP